MSKRLIDILYFIAMGVAGTYSVALLIGAFTSARAETLEMATSYTDDSFQTKNIALFAEDLANLTEGQLNIKLHTAGSKYKLSQIENAVIMRDQTKIDLGEILLSASDQIPLSAADAIPFVARGYEDARRLYGYQKQILDASLQDMGLRLLFAVPWPPQGLYTQTPIKTWRDLRGTKMRYYNEWTRKIAIHAKADAVDVANADINAALKSGAMNAMITSPASGVTSKAWEHLRYFYPINAWVPKNIVFISEVKFQSMSDQVRKSIMTASMIAEERGWQMSIDAFHDSMKTLKANGMTIGDVSYDLDDELTKLGDRFAAQWVRKEGNAANDIFLPYFTEALRQ